MKPAHNPKERVGIITRIIKSNARIIAWGVVFAITAIPVVWNRYGPVKAWLDRQEATAQKVEATAQKVEAVEGKVAGMSTKLEQTSEDVAYIRGRIDGRLPVAERRVAARTNPEN